VYNLACDLIQYQLIERQRLSEILGSACKFDEIPDFIFSPPQTDLQSFLAAVAHEIISGDNFKHFCNERSVPDEEYKVLFAKRQIEIRHFLLKKLSEETQINIKMMSAVLMRIKTFNHMLPPKISDEQISLQTSNFKFEFKVLDEQGAEDFCNDFDDLQSAAERKIMLLKAKKLPSSELPKIEESLQNIFRILHSLKGSCRFASLSMTEKIIHVAEDLLGFLQLYISQIENDSFQTSLQLILEVLDISCQIRILVKESKSEEQFWLAEENQIAYEKLYIRVSEFHKSLESKGYMLLDEDLKSQF
jgi:HPt (histidine-containing phosphotransfer) domain-containing protein